MELERIAAYWNERAEGFSLSNREQLSGEAREEWLTAMLTHVPREGKLSCLDVGCGPGFLAILLAQNGHEVSGVDYTENMLDHARRNAQSEGVSILFERMDAQALTFADNSFDFVVSRNVTWNLERPEQAYAEWLRVLKPGGKLLNFDGNHYLHHYDPLYRQFRESESFVDPHKKEHLQGVDTRKIEAIAMNLPLSRVERPSWDVQALLTAGAMEVSCGVTRNRFRSGVGREHALIQRFYVCAVK